MLTADYTLAVIIFRQHIAPSVYCHKYYHTDPSFIAVITSSLRIFLHDAYYTAYITLNIPIAYSGLCQLYVYGLDKIPVMFLFLLYIVNYLSRRLYGAVTAFSSYRFIWICYLQHIIMG